MRILWTALAAIALLIGGYVFWWNTAADTFLDMAEQQKQKMVDLGYEVSHGELSVDGFPYRLRLSVPDLKVTRPFTEENQKGEFSTPEAWVVAQPWNPFKIIYGSEGTYREALYEGLGPDPKLIAEFLSDEFIGSASLTKEGQVERFAMDLKKNRAFTEFSGGGDITIARMQFHMRPSVATETEPSHPEQPEKTTKVPGTEVALRFEDALITPKNAGGDPIAVPKVAILMAWDGSSDIMFAPEKVKEWATNGNALEVKSLTVDWTSGRIEGNGTFTLDQHYRPLGTAAVKIWGLDKINPIMFTSLAMLMPPAKDEKDEMYLNGSFTLQDGWLSSGEEKIMRLDPLFSE